MPLIDDLVLFAASCPSCTCPPPKPMAVCQLEKGVDVSVHIIEANSDLHMRLTCGQRETNGGRLLEECVLVETHTERDGVKSLTSDEMSYPRGACQPVPEPGVWMLLALGVLALAFVGRKKP